MNKKPVKNVAASVHQRLLDKARQTGRPFNELLQYFAIERFLFRLSESKYAKNFVLKATHRYLRKVCSVNGEHCRIYSA